MPPGGDEVYYFSVYLTAIGDEACYFDLEVNGMSVCTIYSDLTESVSSDEEGTSCSGVSIAVEGKYFELY